MVFEIKGGQLNYTHYIYKHMFPACGYLLTMSNVYRPKFNVYEFYKQIRSVIQIKWHNDK